MFTQYDAIMHHQTPLSRFSASVVVYQYFDYLFIYLFIYLFRPFCYLRNCCGRQTDRQTDNEMAAKSHRKHALC